MDQDQDDKTLYAFFLHLYFAFLPLQSTLQLHRDLSHTGQPHLSLTILLSVLKWSKPLKNHVN